MKSITYRNRLSTRRISIILLHTGLAAVVSVGSIPLLTKSTEAATFNPGNIISETVMARYSAMTTQQIQQFLNAKGSSCSGTLCLKNYSQNGNTAAQILYSIAQKYRINPQVFLVTLQKEVGLITTTSPQTWMYRTAMGFGCPDSTPGVCDSQYYGFTNQVDSAGRFFRAHLDNNPGWYKPHIPGWNNILYNPQPSCGTKSVFIQNRATSALYSYTPYVPNQAALDAGYGTGNGCSSYGNRNFHLYFNAWFGSTQVTTFSPMSKPRYLETSRNTSKIDTATGLPIGGTIEAGRLIKFEESTLFRGYCLRTSMDVSRQAAYCIPLDDLQDFTITYTQFSEPTVMTLPSTISKLGLRNQEPVGGTLPRYRQVVFVASTEVLGTEYFITSKDRNDGNEYGIRSSELVDSSQYDSTDAKTISVEPGAKLVMPALGKEVAELDPDRIYVTTSEATLPSGDYLRLESHDNNNLDIAVSENAATPASFQQFSSPRYLRLTTTTPKNDLISGKTESVRHSAGKDVFFDHKININGVTYYRTAVDSRWDRYLAIPASKTGASLLNSFSPFSNPRLMTLLEDTKKTDPYSGRAVGPLLSKSSKIFFDSKIVIDGNAYYRSAHDTRNANPYIIPAKSVR